MVTTNDNPIAEKIKRLRDHGAEISDLQRHLGPKLFCLQTIQMGYNQRMTDIQAALGSAQMDRANEIVSERQRLANNYNQAFSNLEWLQIPKISHQIEHGYHPTLVYSNQMK